MLPSTNLLVFESEKEDDFYSKKDLENFEELKKENESDNTLSLELEKEYKKEIDVSETELFNEFVDKTSENIFDDISLDNPNFEKIKYFKDN